MRTLRTPYFTGVVCLLSLATGSTWAQVTATNDAKAVFEGGLFRLPPVDSEKNTYTILIKEGQEGKTRKLQLPAGSSGLVLSAPAYPKSPWEWRYTLQTEVVDIVEAVGPNQRRVTYSELAQFVDSPLVEWNHMKEAASYRLVTQVDKESDHTKDPSWGDETKTDLSVEEYVDAQRGLGHYNLPLATGGRTQWKVQALDADGKIIAQSQPVTLVADTPWLSKAVASGFKLQRSDTLSSREFAGRPAIFGYASTAKDGKRNKAYQAEFAVIWIGGQDHNFAGFYPRASMEARLRSAGSDKDSDALKFRFGGNKQLESIDGEFTASLKYETESKNDTKKALVELAFAPAFYPFARYLPRPTTDRVGSDGNYKLGETPAVQVIPQLTVGLDFGRTLDVGSSAETTKTISRQWADLRLDFQLNFIADALRLPGVTFYGQTKRWHLNRQSPSSYHLSSTGLNFKITKELSLDLNYTIGADVPSFTFGRSAGVNLGLQF